MYSGNQTGRVYRVHKYFIFQIHPTHLAKWENSDHQRTSDSPWKALDITETVFSDVTHHLHLYFAGSVSALVTLLPLWASVYVTTFSCWIYTDELSYLSSAWGAELAGGRSLLGTSLNLWSEFLRSHWHNQHGIGSSKLTQLPQQIILSESLTGERERKKSSLSSQASKSIDFEVPGHTPVMPPSFLE